MVEQIKDCMASLDVSFKIYPLIPSCTFILKIDLMRYYLNKSISENNMTIFAYGICHSQILDLLTEYGDRVIRLKGNNCFEMFLGKEKYTEFYEKCFWMLNKPFFTKYKKDLLAGFEIGTKNCKTLIKDTFKKLVYLKFEKDPLDTALVEDFARSVDLEFEIHSTDLKNLKRLLEEALASASPTSKFVSMKHYKKSEIQTILENIGEIIYEMDLHTRNFTFISPQVKSILGYTPVEFIDIMNDIVKVDLYHEEDKERVITGRFSFIVKCLNEGMQQPFEIEYRMKHKKGNILWLWEIIYPNYSSDGQIESFVGKIVDITKRKKMEQKLIQIDNMRKKFISSFSHELRSPISVIIQSIENILDYKENMSEELQLKLMKIIFRNAQFLSEMVEDLLAISKVDERRIELDWGEYQIFEILNNILNQMEPHRKT
ncbi:MAG: PAS domain-containing protein, partial [Candidatus Hodarchaeota archaeon]